MLALTLAALFAPLAMAQLPPAIDLRASPGSVQAYPGDPALFHVDLRNDGLVTQTVSLVDVKPDGASSSLPAGWTFEFASTSLLVPAGGTANTTLVIRVPSSALTNANVTFSFKGRDSANNLDITQTVSVNVTVVARPVSTAPTPTNTPARPALTLQTTGNDKGYAGSDVSGVLTLLNSDATRTNLRVSLDISGIASWKPTIHEADRFRVLAQGAPAKIPLHVTIPTLDADTTESFTIRATVDGIYQFDAVWTVIGLAKPTPPAESPPASSDTPQGPSETGSTPAKPTPGPGLSIALAADIIDIAPGESASGKLHVVNTGGTSMRISLSGSAPSEWTAPVFEAISFDLAPGAARDVTFSLAAPSGIPVPIGGSGGSGAGTIVAQSDSGVVRSIPYKVNIVPPSTPRQETAAETQAPVSEGGIPETTNIAVAISLGLGAVGAGAVMLARRPIREKLLWAAMGLYTRIARPDVLGHEDRERLYRLVESQPGIHFHALQRDLSWNTGTLTYHVRVLERHGFMVSRRDGLYRRFYLAGAAPRKEVFENQGPTGLRADVLEAVRNQHGISQTDLSLALSANKQTVNYHVKALERQGLIRVEKRGRDTFLYPQVATPPDVARA